MLLYVLFVVSGDRFFGLRKDGQKIKDEIETHLMLAKLKSEESSSDWKIDSEEANVSSPESTISLLIGLKFGTFFDFRRLMSF